MNTQKFCDQCGAEIEFGSKFCDACGQPLQDIGEKRTSPHPAQKRQARARAGSFLCQRIAWALIFELLLIPVVLYLIWKDVGEFSSDVWLSLGVFIVITTILAVITLRKAGGTWQGEFVEAQQKYQGIQMSFITDQGKTKVIFGSSSLLHYYMPGDKVIKIKGYDFPEKIERDGKRQLCVVCGKVYPGKDSRCPSCRYPSINPLNFI